MTNEVQTYYNLVSSVKQGGTVRQINELSLGASFDIPKKHWNLLTASIEEILSGKDPARLLPEGVEKAARDLAKRIEEKRAKPGASKDEPGRESPEGGFYVLDMSPVMKTGAALAAVEAMSALDYERAFVVSGVSETAAKIVMARIAAFMENPADEGETFTWLQRHSEVGRILGVDFEKLSREDLSSAIIDVLVADENIAKLINISKNASLSQQNRILLLNLYPTAAAILNNENYIERSIVYYDSIARFVTLAHIVTKLNPSKETLITVDHSIAAPASVKWLREEGYAYLIPHVEPAEAFNPEKIEKRFVAKSGRVVSVFSERPNDAATPRDASKPKNVLEDELKLFCRLEGRAPSNAAELQKACEEFEEGLRAIDKKLRSSSKPTAFADFAKQLGLLKTEHPVSRHYEMTVAKKDLKIGPVARSLDWKRVKGRKPPNPIYLSLRTNARQRNPEDIWEAYASGKEAKAVFRSLKPELGLPLMFHQSNELTQELLFIAGLAYQCVNLLRSKLANFGISDSWPTIVKNLTQAKIGKLTLMTGKGPVIRNVSTLISEKNEFYLTALGLRHLF